MGQAKQRGSFEERKAQALTRASGRDSYIHTFLAKHPRLARLVLKTLSYIRGG